MICPDLSKWWQARKVRMSAIVKEVYDALRSAGVSDDLATAAARSVPASSELATKGDIRELRSEIRELRAETKSDMKELELRMTLKFFAAIGMAVAGIKALDFLVG